MLSHKWLCRVNSAVLYSTINLMLFSGKTMASPQNSVSCQVFVKRQYQNAAFFSFPGLFPCLMLGQAWRVQGCHPEIRGILTIAGFQ